jgi:hypothetical protein
MKPLILILAVILCVSPANVFANDYAVIMLGNSHTTKNKLPKILETLLANDGKGATAEVKASRHWRFLDERLDDGTSQKLLESEQWTHVVLQAQKYSSSGRYFYPTDAAEEWIRRAKAQDAAPILFPEWARRGNTEEGPRLQTLHEEIAAREAACVAPVGVAWEIVRESNPDLVLHHPDGNHSNKNGAHLTAYVLYEAVSQKAASDLPDIAALKIDAELQSLFKNAASLAFDSAQSCQY